MLVESRYLLVRETDAEPMATDSMALSASPEEPKVGKYLVQEHNRSTILASKRIDVPQPSYQLDKLVKGCVSGRKQIVLVAEDRSVFDGPKDETPDSGADMHAISDTRYVPRHAGRVWKPDTKWSQRNADELLPPPTESSPLATAALQKELRAMMREQNIALERNDLETLGWYFPPQHNEDNLYQWLVELHSFDPELPIAKDMKSKWALECKTAGVLTDDTQRCYLGCDGDSVSGQFPSCPAIFSCDSAALPTIHGGKVYATCSM